MSIHLHVKQSGDELFWIWKRVTFHTRTFLNISSPWWLYFSTFILNSRQKHNVDILERKCSGFLLVQQNTCNFHWGQLKSEFLQRLRTTAAALPCCWTVQPSSRVEDVFSPVTCPAGKHPSLLQIQDRACAVFEHWQVCKGTTSCSVAVLALSHHAFTGEQHRCGPSYTTCCADWGLVAWELEHMRVEGSSPQRKQCCASPKDQQVVFTTIAPLPCSTAQTAMRVNLNSASLRHLPGVERLCLEPDRKCGLLKPGWCQHSEGQQAGK